MFAGLNGWHLLILLAVILLLFGAAKLPALARSMGQSARAFKGEMSAMKEEDAARAKLDEKTETTEGSTAAGSATTTTPASPDRPS
ncbi:sec-independent protein translocase protein TatA [Microbacterium resistens]|uniref:Sec-independent protein translocase protein TatA n=1 Tax=Microbacterium resistens TaxID=156977 RepID=A0ABU1SF31_9MICO|nr:twin-arginine translocase TatA/TatE family subunit [Microbacterium resistens]MDR6868214.1 sec-independent protein translocase protein TatA [Microbacterium resistens]